MVGRFRPRQRPAVASGQSDGQGRILRFVFFHSPVLAGMVGLLV